MTQDEIIDMAKQAGIEEAYSLKHNQYLVRFKDGSLEAFAKLVAATDFGKEYDSLSDMVAVMIAVCREHHRELLEKDPGR